MCFCFGAAFWWARDLRTSRAAMVLQLLVAIVVGTIGLLNVTSWTAQIIVLIATAVTIANGLDNLRKTLGINLSHFLEPQFMPWSGLPANVPLALPRVLYGYHPQSTILRACAKDF